MPNTERPAILPAVIEGLQTIGPICEVLSAQLEHVVEETETASSTFAGQLTAIDAAVATLTDKVAELAEATRQGREMGEFAARNADLVSELTQTVKTRDTTIRSLVRDVHELDAEADAIRDISRTTNILGLNALIVAAHAGDQGAAFGVVAHEVRSLSTKSDTSARQIRSGIDALTQKINEALSSTGDATSTDLDAQLAQITDMQLALQQQQASLTQATTAIVEEVKNTATQLASLTLEAMSAVQFQDLVRQLVEHVQASLTRIGEHARALAANAGGELNATELERLRTNLTELKRTYVTQRQRETHGRLTATATAADTAPTIELF
ncbi:MAG: methyl-accepting chemotaxis protein [Solirubrobacteraceae bacterium]